MAALDGHPLSLVLVAGRAGRGMSLTTLLRRLEDNGDEAVIAREYMAETKPAPDEELRAKRLISSLNLSLKPLLSNHPAAAELFLWLGLFPAGLLLKAIPDIFGEAATKHRDLLLDFNLAEIDEGDAPRLFLPSPVRWYAKRRLGEVAAERQAVLLTSTLRAMGRHLREAMAQSLSEHAPRSLALALREEPNLAALLPKACSETAGGPERAEGVADALLPWLYLMSRAGRPTTALTLGEQAAAAISVATPGTSEEARLLKALGDLYVRTDRLREAEDAYQSALPIYQQIEDRLGEANTRKALGDLYVRTDRLRVDSERQTPERPWATSTVARLAARGRGCLPERTAHLRADRESTRRGKHAPRAGPARAGSGGSRQCVWPVPAGTRQPTFDFRPARRGGLLWLSGPHRPGSKSFGKGRIAGRIGLAAPPADRRSLRPTRSSR